MARLAAPIALCILVACKRDDAPQPPPPAPAVAIDPVHATVEPAGDPCATAGKPEGSIAWIADDYPAALACARQKDLPLMIDMWAPWCHTCLSMRSTVFLDPALAVDADKLVWVSLDTDKDVNAAAVGKFPPAAWPTFFVVAPDESVLARFVGSSSVPQFQAFLDSGQKARAGGAAGADARLLGAERAAALHDLATAEQELTAALAAAPPDWARRPDALTSLIATKQHREDYAGCVALAMEVMAKPAQLGRTTSASDFLSTAMACADKRAELDAPGVKAVRTAAVARWKAMLADSKAQLSIDDRSDAMASEREAIEALGDKAGARAVAEEQKTMLDDTANKAPDPMAAMTYNWPRAEVYTYLGRPLELVPALEKSAKDLPKEYDPYARLGWIYLRAGKLAEAATWTDRALPLVYGPRKARVLSQRAEIAAGQHDAQLERSLLEQIVTLWETMPAGQANPDALANAKLTLAKLDKH